MSSGRKGWNLTEPINLVLSNILVTKFGAQLAHQWVGICRHLRRVLVLVVLVVETFVVMVVMPCRH